MNMQYTIVDTCTLIIECDRSPIIHDYMISVCHENKSTINMNRSKDWELPRRKNNYKQRRRSKR